MYILPELRGSRARGVFRRKGEGLAKALQYKTECLIKGLELRGRMDEPI